MEGLPGEPAADRARRVPVELPEQRLAPGLVLDERRGLRPPRSRTGLAGSVGLPPDRRDARRSDRGADVHDDRQQQQRAGAVGAPGGSERLPADEPDPGLPLSVDERLVTRRSATRRTSWSGVGNDIAAAVANLFAMHNRLHDFAYNLGFTEVTWNSQRYNYGSPAPSRTTRSPATRRPRHHRRPSGLRRPRQREHEHGGRRHDRRRRTCSCGSRSRARSTPRAWTATTTCPSSATSSAT